MSRFSSFVEGFPLVAEVRDDLRTSARRIKYACDVASRKPTPKEVPMMYGSPNKPTQGEVTGS